MLRFFKVNLLHYNYSVYISLFYYIIVADHGLVEDLFKVIAVVWCL